MTGVQTCALPISHLCIEAPKKISNVKISEIFYSFRGLLFALCHHHTVYCNDEQKHRLEGTEIVSRWKGNQNKNALQVKGIIQE